MTLRYVLGTARRRVRGRLRHRPWEGAGALAGLRFVLPRGFEYFVAYAEYEPELVAALERLVHPGFVCADLGANVGVLTLLLARSAGPEGRVIAFEPAPENISLLLRNVALNPELADRIVVEQTAVSDGLEPWIELHGGGAGGHAGWTVSSEFAGRVDPKLGALPTTRVNAQSLDEYFLPGARLDLVKMDVEGAEGKALDGMTRLLREARPVIVLEFHREVGWPAIPLLLDAGYRLETLSGDPLPQLDGPADVPYHLVAYPGSTI